RTTERRRSRRALLRSRRTARASAAPVRRRRWPRTRGRRRSRCRRPSANGGRVVGASGEGIVAVSLATRVANRGLSPGAVVLAAGIPILLLHIHYQPGLSIG